MIYLNGFTELDELREENEGLRKENDELIKACLNSYKKGNSELKKALELACNLLSLLNTHNPTDFEYFKSHCMNDFLQQAKEATLETNSICYDCNHYTSDNENECNTQIPCFGGNGNTSNKEVLKDA